MEIIWHGKTCFTLKGSSAIAVTDPYVESGMARPKLKSDLVTLSVNPPTDKALEKIEGEPRIFDWPGEYEAKGVLLTGIDTGEQNTILFQIEIDGFRLAHLGHLRDKLSEEMIEKLGDVDVLLIPVGGGEAIDHKLAHEVIEQVDPRMVIPMNYEDSSAFLKEVGTYSEPRESLVLKNRGELPEENMQFVVLNPKLGA